MAFFPLNSLEQGLRLAVSDIKQEHQKTFLGPLWITIGLAVLASCIGLVFGSVFGLPLDQYLPSVVGGLLVWFLFSQGITEMSEAFTERGHLLKQIAISPDSILVRTFFRAVFNLLVGLPVLLVILFIFNSPKPAEVIEGGVGFLLVVIAIFLIGCCAAYISLIFPDFTQLVRSIMTVGFYASPIIWLPGQAAETQIYQLLVLNPLWHLLRVSRDPLVGISASMGNWIVLLGTIVISMALLIFLKATAPKNLALLV